MRWQVSTEDGGTWSDVAGATAGTYTFTAAAAQDGHRYRAEFHNEAGTTRSAPMTLTVKAPDGSGGGETDPPGGDASGGGTSGGGGTGSGGTDSGGTGSGGTDSGGTAEGTSGSGGASAGGTGSTGGGGAAGGGAAGSLASTGATAGAAAGTALLLTAAGWYLHRRNRTARAR